MRFVRIQADADVTPVGLAEAAASGRLDLVQLDYARPRIAATGDEPAVLPDLATGFGRALSELRKSLFLEPGLCVISSAGWADAYGCVEQAAEALVAGGCGELAVAAVRGSNLLPILDMLAASGVDLSHADTGAPWRELRSPVLAADLQLGAGPIETALAEGARVVVVGSYDFAAPAIAAGRREFDWKWDDYDRLARAAVAARAAVWPGTPPMPMLGHPRVEVDQHGEISMELARAADPAAAQSLEEWLRAVSAADAVHVHSDLRCQMAGVHARVGAERQLLVTGCAGSPSDSRWRLDVLHQRGFLVESLVEFAQDASPQTRGRLTEALRGLTVDPDDENGQATVQEIGQAGSSGVSWLHLAQRSKSRRACQQFAARITAFVAAGEPRMRLAGGRPAVQIEIDVWPARIPRDAVDIAVDTRPAHEWA